MKKYIALLLALVMALSLCACTEDEPTASTTKPAASGTNPSGPADPSTPSQPEEGSFCVVNQIKCRLIDDEDSFVTLNLTYDADYNVTGLQIYENNQLTSTTTCDKTLDKPLLVQYHDETGKVYGYMEWVYDEDGKVLTEHTYMNGEQLMEAIYTYDDHGNLKTKYFDNGEEDWTEIYENLYQDGKLTQTNLYIRNMLQTSWRYDSEGNLILDTYYHEDGSTSSTKYVYENGKLALTVNLDGDEETSREECAYNADGNILSRVIKVGDHETYREAFFYNSAGMPTEIRYTHDDGYYAKTVMTYGEDGSPKTLQAYDKDELELECTFTIQKATISQEQARDYVILYAELIEAWT